MSPANTLVTVTIDGVEVSVEPGTLIIRAAEEAGIAIPRFCDHPLLDPVGACRQCLVDVASPGPDGGLRAFPKPQAACTMPVSPGMVVHTALTSEAAASAERSVMELILASHPLDCPICDKAGECPLQNQAMSVGRATSRYTGPKRTYPKPIPLTAEILLDRERCVLCQRCTRFVDQIAGDPFIALQERGSAQQVGRRDPAAASSARLGESPSSAGAAPRAGLADPTDAVTAELAPISDTADLTPVARSGQLATTELAPVPEDGLAPREAPGWERAADGTPFASYYSGNIVQLCPVGALTSTAYRFRSRPFDLVSTESVAEHDASCSAIRVDVRAGGVQRRLAGNDPDVNREWLTDKDRFAFAWQSLPERLTTPWIRENGVLREANWPEALEAAARGLGEAGAVGVLPGGRLTVEDALAYAVMARAVLGTDDIDFRARPHSAEEAEFLAHAVAGAGRGVTFADLAAAKRIVLVGFEPEEEGGIVFLRLREAAKAGAAIVAIAPYASPGVRRLGASLIQIMPGDEAAAMDGWRDDAGALSDTIILLGERIALAPGAFASALAARRAGARIAWIARRVGERGAVEAGCLPGPPRPALAEAIAAHLGDHAAPPAPAEREARDTTAILAAAMSGEIGGLLVAGVDLADLPNPAQARAGLDRAFTVSLEVLPSAATALADVVLPVAPPSEKPGTYVTWEGRMRPFPQVLATTAMSDATVLSAIAGRLGVPVDLSMAAAHAILAKAAEAAAGPTSTAPPDSISPLVDPVHGPHAAPVAGEALLSTWHLHLDAGRLLSGEPHLAATAKAPVAVISGATAFEIDIREGELVRVSTSAGAIVVPVHIGDIPDRVVWLPTNSPGCQVRATLGVPAGIVHIEAAMTDQAEVRT
ncbi:MAG: NADH-quinone oxidoreductase subunit G [Bifidobacteriaceae bacterium]|nr:NADH-quinone oxidoreductase subunit G [Bifidobacteriaceae bacterium]